MNRLDNAAKDHDMSKDEIQWMRERAAIVEIDGGLSAQDADERAVDLTLRRRNEQTEKQ